MANPASIDALIQHSKNSNSFAKQCLKTAMLQLAKEMDYKQITVTQLCKKAGVSRMAFYRNYDITNDIIYDIAKDLNEEVIRQVGSPFRNHTTKQWYVSTFQYIADHKEECSLMLTENFQYQWMRIVNNYAVHDKRFPAEKKYQRMMWSGGFENIVSYWLNNGMQESPEQLADYCIEYLPHLLISQ